MSMLSTTADINMHCDILTGTQPFRAQNVHILYCQAEQTMTRHDHMIYGI